VSDPVKLLCKLGNCTKCTYNISTECNFHGAILILQVGVVEDAADFKDLAQFGRAVTPQPLQSKYFLYWCIK